MGSGCLPVLTCITGDLTAGDAGLLLRRDRRVSVGRTENLPHQRLPITISTSLPSILLRCAGMKELTLRQ